MKCEGRYRVWDSMNRVYIDTVFLDCFGNLFQREWSYENHFDIKIVPMEEIQYSVEWCLGYVDSGGEFVYEGDIIELSDGSRHLIFSINSLEDYSLFDLGEVIHGEPDVPFSVIGNWREDTELLAVG